jgi:hypothetical protein
MSGSVDQLLALVSERNRRFARTEDPSAVLGPEALAETNALLRATTDANGALTDAAAA